jgi:hypothetical protein
MAPIAAALRLDDRRPGPDGTNGPIAKARHVHGWPTVYVIDHDGVIRHKSHGGAAMEAAVRTCVAAAQTAR